MEFVEAPTFTELVPEYLSDDEYAALQQFLVRDPEAGDVISGTGGFRRFDGRIRVGARASVAVSG